MRVSVLICTYNRAELLKQALTALIDDTIEKPTQIVIVNGGDDKADHIVEAFIGKYDIDITVIKTQNINLATSRNIGLHICYGDIIAMTDDDAEVFPDWITQIKKLHQENGNAGAIGGKIIGAKSDISLLSRLSDIATFPQPDKPCVVRTVPGVNVSYKRDAVDKVGLQDEALFRGEDVDYNWRVKQLGYDILFHPDIKVIHHHRPTLRKFFMQHYMYGRAYYLVRRKWPEMYCVYPKKLKSLRDYLKLGNFFFLNSL